MAVGGKLPDAGPVSSWHQPRSVVSSRIQSNGKYGFGTPCVGQQDTSREMCRWSPVICQEKRRHRAGASRSGALPATILIGEDQIRAGRITPFVVFIATAVVSSRAAASDLRFGSTSQSPLHRQSRRRPHAEESLRRCDMRRPILPAARTFCALIHVLAAPRERQDRCSGGMVRALHLCATEREM